MTDYEIIANPEEYGIEALVEGFGGNPIEFPAGERRKWANEIGTFAQRLQDLSSKAQTLQQWLQGQHAIKATPASLKTLKIQLFKVNDALDNAMGIVGKLESDIVPPITRKG
jgi:hypothetical protein